MKPDVERQGKQPDRQRPVRFLLLFSGLLVLFQVLFVAVLAPSPLFASYLNLNARMSSFVLGLLGHAAIAQGDAILCGLGSLQIKRGCDAAQPCGILVAAVLAYPGTWKAKLAAAGLGVLVLSGLNVVRIVTLVFAAGGHPRVFDLLHEAVWPTAMILIAFALWAAWIRIGRSAPEPAR